VADPATREQPEPSMEAGASGAFRPVVRLVRAEEQDKIEGYLIRVLYFKSKGHKNEGQLPLKHSIVP
jgi:hypothetical protein